MDAFIMKIICGNNGAMDYEELVDIGSGLMDLKGVFGIVFGNPRDFSVVVFNGKKRVIAKTNVRLCKVGGCVDCSNLHLCKFYLYGDCKASRRRNGCRFCHDMSSQHNSKVLAENNLQLLDSKELRTLLLQNDNTLLPPVCVSFNEGSKEYGNCPEQAGCRRLHVCDKYIRGICDSGVDCCRSHDFFEPHPMTILQDRGIPTDLITSMLSVYQNIRALKFKKSVTRGGRDQQKPVSEKTEICLYFVKGSCKQGGKCWRVHFNMPYRWEVQDEKGWSPLPNNEGIEKDYCNPAMTKSEGQEPVCFDTMTRGLAIVRRLSTLSSVQKPDFILTTEWAWYWEDEYGNWIKYGSMQQGSHRLSNITSEDLERQYQEDNSAEVKFTAGNQSYQVNLQDMSQRNEKYSTVRRIRRRPVFVSSADAQKIRTGKRPNNTQNFKALPQYWDKSLIPETGHKKVMLQSSTEEYQKILDLFQKTMRGFNVQSIERIQNRSLWEVFQWQRDQMKKINTGKYSVEKFLFHGTDSKYVDAICKQNFDWRICGTHGTAYGKGSYFARDAKYSHSYTSSSELKTMFVCRVLVGEYTRGNQSYVRPPSKDGGDTIFYDSCVDDVKNPSIFVVFEKHQVYPEYLIQYNEDTWSSSTVTVQTTPSLQYPVPASTAYPVFSSPVQAPSKSNATSSALFNQLQVPPSSSATSSALSKQLQAPPSSSSTSSTLSKQLQAPPSSSSTSSALLNQPQAPASSGATWSAVSTGMQASASSTAISSKSSVNVIPTQLYWASNSTQSSSSTNPTLSKSLSPTHNTTTQYSGSTASYSFTQAGLKSTLTRPTTQVGSTVTLIHPTVQTNPIGTLIHPTVQTNPMGTLTHLTTQASPRGTLIHPTSQANRIGTLIHPTTQASPRGTLIHPTTQAGSTVSLIHSTTQASSTGTLIHATAQASSAGTLIHPTAQANRIGTLIHPTTQADPRGTLIHPTTQAGSTGTLIHPTAQANRINTLMRPTVQTNPIGTLIHPTTKPNPIGTLIHPTTQASSTGTLIHPTTQVSPRGTLIHPNAKTNPRGTLIHPTTQANPIGTLIHPAILANAIGTLIRPTTQAGSTVTLIPPIAQVRSISTRIAQLLGQDKQSV
ncbi:protein mono-ADP-ribosyltransferase PARP12-like isoform X3 [Brienomyrus brachyistius]|uniref:protein mono-ADP-ribosyltransferase PARP12-like isoform X3 n=1 Tax=Brienomyrus brachyistius TaxID=42636 RepID=UPI0020B37032|nr:protein mono-ADP-ribosyltransferase PARP12-like isoform X3 [Brienomyrus brachyistius]